MAGKGFKIADAYVQIHAAVARTEFLNDIGKFIAKAPLIAAAATSLAGLAAAAVSVASSLSLASLSSTAIIPAALGVLSVFGLLKIMFTDATGPIKKFVDQLKGMKDKFKEIATTTSLKGLTQFFSSLNALLPTVNLYVARLGQIIGYAAMQLATLNKNAWFQARFRDLLVRTSEGMNYLAEAADAVIDIIVTLGAAAAPVFARLALWLDNTLHKWERWLNVRYATGELQTLLKKAADEASKWGQIVGNFLSGFIGILNAARGPATSFSSSITEVSKSFKDWAWDPKTQEEIRKIIDFLLSIDYVKMWQISASISAVGYALQIFSGLTGVPSLLVGIVQGFAGLMALGPVGLIILGVVAALVQLAIILAIGTGALVGAYFSSETFRAGVNDLYNDVKNLLVPELKEIWAWFQEKIQPKFEEMANNVLPQLRNSLRETWTMWTENKAEVLRFIDILTSVVIPIIGFVLVQAFRAVIGVIQSVIFIVGWLGRIFDTVHDQGVRMRDGVVGAFNDIKRDIKAAADWVSSQVNRIIDIFHMLERNKPSIGGMIGGVVGGILGHANGGIVGAAASGGLRTGLTMVGEQGPELVHLPAGTRVRTNPDTERMVGSGGGGNHFHFHIAGSIRSDRDFLRIVRDEFTNLGFT